jgi:hypothetical protein
MKTSRVAAREDGSPRRRLLATILVLALAIVAPSVYAASRPAKGKHGQASVTATIRHDARTSLSELARRQAWLKTPTAIKQRRASRTRYRNVSAHERLRSLAPSTETPSPPT